MNDDNLTTVPADEPTKAAVERRVKDWLDRLNQMFSYTEIWAEEHGWSIIHPDAIIMNEELMVRSGVSQQKQPMLRLERADGGFALFKPKGLWVIGANGRIDLYTSQGAFVIVDQAEPFDNPVWKIYGSDKKKLGSIYSPEVLDEVV